MKIQEHLRHYLADEFDNVYKSIEAAQGDMTAIIFYLSACHGAISRVLNIEFDNELVLLHIVFNGCHNTLNNRLAAIGQNTERPINIPDELPLKLAGIVNEFAKEFRENGNVIDLLPRLASLCYVTTGNGFYLYQTGRLKL